MGGLVACALRCPVAGRVGSAVQAVNARSGERDRLRLQSKAQGQNESEGVLHPQLVQDGRAGAVRTVPW